jgi:ParB family chromosome partitioning protein
MKKLNKDDTKKVKPFMAIFGDDYDPEANNSETLSQDMLNIEQLVGFKNHPFKLYEGERLDEMVKSIKQFGVIVPIVVRKKKLKYEILSGHNRVEACKVIGLKEIPAVVKEGLTKEEALLIVTETNTMQRSFGDLPHSERATVVAVRHEAMKKQGYRTDLLEEIERLSKSPNVEETSTSSPMAKKLKQTTLGKVGEEYGLGKDSIARYLRIAKLPNEFKELVDSGQIAIRAGVDLSYLKEESLDIVHAIITEENFKIDMNRARNLRGADKKAPLTFDSAHAIIKGEIKEKKPKPPKYWSKVFMKHFKPEQEEVEVMSIIDKALAMYYSTIQKKESKEDIHHEESEDDEMEM